MLAILLVLLLFGVAIAESQEGEDEEDDIFGGGSGEEDEDDIFGGGADEEAEELPELDPEDLKDETGDLVATEDTTGQMDLDTSENAFYDADGDGITGYTGTANIENGVITGGIFSANADASLLKIQNSLFDMYFDMSEGDTIEVTETSPTGNALDYLLNIMSEGVTASTEYDNGATQEFTATENDSIYAVYGDGVFEVTDGILTYEDEDIQQTLESGEERSEVTVTDTGIKKGILYKNKTFSQKSYTTDLNITIINEENDEYVICTEEDEDCQATLIDNVLYTEGEVIVLQDGVTLYESLHPSTVVTADFLTKTLTVNNVKPRNGNDELLEAYIGHWKVTETKDQVYFYPVSELYSEVMESYVSELQSKELTYDEGTLSFNTLKAFTPNTDEEEDCLEDKEDDGYC